jgi:hypothetical protein
MAINGIATTINIFEGNVVTKTIKNKRQQDIMTSINKFYLGNTKRKQVSLRAADFDDLRNAKGLPPHVKEFMEGKVLVKKIEV